MEIDAERIGEHELHLPHRIAWAGKLADAHFPPPRSDRRPIDPRRVDRHRAIVPAREHLIALQLEKPGPLFDDLGRDPPGGEIGRDVPNWVERGEADQRGHYRSRIDLLADHDPHGADCFAALDHRQLRGGGVDDHVVPAARRKCTGAVEIERQQITIAATGDDRAAQAGVDRVRPAHLRQIRLERRRSGGFVEQAAREDDRRAKLGIDPDHVAVLQAPNVANMVDEGIGK